MLPPQRAYSVELWKNKYNPDSSSWQINWPLPNYAFRNKCLSEIMLMMWNLKQALMPSPTSPPAVCFAAAVDLTRECVDQPHLANCELILQAQLCTNEYYSSFCCASCSRYQSQDSPSRQQGWESALAQLQEKAASEDDWTGTGVERILSFLIPKFTLGA